MLIITRYILKHELAPILRNIDLQDLLIGAQKVRANLAVELKGGFVSQSVKFFKVRIGKKAKARMIVFLTTNNSIVPVVIKLKKDKKYGQNLSMNNEDVKNLISRNLDSIHKDVENGDFESYEV
jgi:hypothetical protein